MVEVADLEPGGHVDAGGLTSVGLTEDRSVASADGRLTIGDACVWSWRCALRCVPGHEPLARARPGKRGEPERLSDPEVLDSSGCECSVVRGGSSCRSRRSITASFERTFETTLPPRRTRSCRSFPRAFPPGGCTWPRDDATGDLGVLIEVVAGADPVVAVGDPQRVAPHEQDRGEFRAGLHLG